MTIVRIDAEARVFSVGEPLRYDPQKPLAEQGDALLTALAAAIHPARPN